MSDSHRETGFTWTAAAVREALGLGGVAAPEDQDRVFRQVSTDTRNLEPGDLFVALEGPNFDGHDFLAEAAARGATGAVVRRIPAGRPAGLPLFPVPDTLVALGALAHHRRIRLPARVVAVTGSSGKTTTKELLRAALGTHLRVHVTSANLNNRVGVPLTLLSAPLDAQVVVVEVGTNEPGEIEALRRVAHPDVAVVVTVSEAHVERLGDLEGVYREKLALVRDLPSGAVVVVGDEPAELADRARAAAPGHELWVAGLSDLADQPWRGRLLEADPVGRWRVGTPSGSFVSPVPGAHGARCALLALAVADLLGVAPELARAGLPSTTLPGMRTEVRRHARGVLLVDCYNANPQSTRAALAWLEALPAEGPRVAILGSMLELGAMAGDLHARILEEALSGAADLVVAVGLFAEALPGVTDPRLLRAPDTDHVLPLLLPRLEPGAVILLKGSRGMALERLVPALGDALDERQGGIG
ncbi:MAG: UDP-N-acetylmuramoyl-tripeptide--D-alanyl-D-alanine ligase [Gemmatimonadales bacterium]|nr:MAG: UDP-N-acetylmuramoyl-tripeptide--D-alanyl-D-alanine ligase [Gemmatimonadales bacterium]